MCVCVGLPIVFCLKVHTATGKHGRQIPTAIILPAPDEFKTNQRHRQTIKSYCLLQYVYMACTLKNANFSRCAALTLRERYLPLMPFTSEPV